jgi:hypothetical protein
MQKCLLLVDFSQSLLLVVGVNLQYLPEGADLLQISQKLQSPLLVDFSQSLLMISCFLLMVLKVHKNENFFGSDFEISTFS